MILRESFFLTLLGGVLFTTPCLADGTGDPNRSNNPPQNVGRPLPGEEVVTPSGKRMKVWTTEGPVPVSQAPEPFEDEDARIDDIDVIVDDRRLQGLREPSRPIRRDSFDLKR